MTLHTAIETLRVWMEVVAASTEREQRVNTSPWDVRAVPTGARKRFGRWIPRDWRQRPSRHVASVGTPALVPCKEQPVLSPNS